MKKLAIILYTMAVLLAGGFLGHLVKDSEAMKYCGRCEGHGVNCDLMIMDENTLSVRVYSPHKIKGFNKVSALDANIYIEK